MENDTEAQAYNEEDVKLTPEPTVEIIETNETIENKENIIQEVEVN